MDLKRKHWNDQQKLLAEALKRKADHARALGLFLPQHAAVHASGLGEPGAWSFDEELWQDLPQAAARRIPTGGEHSIAWLVWRMARCEDITFNLLVAGCPQVIDEGGWMEKTRATVYDTGNAMNVAQVARFSAAIDLDALRAYRAAVGRRTREIVRALPVGGFQRPVDAADVQRIGQAGAVLEEAGYLIDYWGKQKVSGLILTPATRHLFVHLNEAMRLKQRKK